MKPFPRNVINFLLLLLVVLIPTGVLAKILPMHPGVIIIFLVFLLWLSYVLLSGTVQTVRASLLFGVFAFLILLSLFSWWFAPEIPSYVNDYNLEKVNPLRSPDLVRIYGVISLIKSLVFAYLIAVLISGRELLKRVLKLLIFSSVAFSLYGIVMFLLNIAGVSINTGLVTGWLAPRIESVSVEPQAFSSYLMCILPILFVGFLAKKDFLFGKKTTLLFLIIDLIAFVLTFSTGGYLTLIGLFIAFVLLLFFTPLKVHIDVSRFLKVTMVFVFALILIGGFAKNYLVATFGKVWETSYDAGLMEREIFWETAVDIMKDRPLLGVGPASYGYFFEKYYGAPSPQVDVQPPQNLFLGMGANIGILGMLSYLFIFGYIFWKLFIKGISRNKNFFLNILSCALFLVVLSLFIQNMAFWTPYAFFLWFFLGLALAFYNNFLMEAK